jgi:hypothetical protein
VKGFYSLGNLLSPSAPVDAYVSVELEAVEFVGFSVTSRALNSIIYVNSAFKGPSASVSV